MESYDNTISMCPFIWSFVGFAVAMLFIAILDAQKDKAKSDPHKNDCKFGDK